MNQNDISDENREKRKAVLRSEFGTEIPECGESELESEER